MIATFFWKIGSTSFRRFGMAPVLFAFFATLFPSFNDATAVGEQTGRSTRELRLDTAAAIARSREVRGADLTGPVLDLCRLHDELVSHPKYSDGGTLVGCRARIATRLGDLLRELERLKPEENTLDQTHDSAYGMLAALEHYHDRQFRMAAYLAGGPAGQFQWMAGNFAPGDENAAALINLIQQTVNPKTWRINGGDASIVWWQTSQALVVHADSMTQDRIQALLIGLRGR